MNKTFTKHFFAVSISIFGLISCSKEKTSARTDTFDLEEPTVQAQFRVKGMMSHSKLQTLKEKVSEPFYITSLITVESLKNHDFEKDPISIQIESTCKSVAENPVTSIFKKLFLNIRSLQMLALIDSNFMVTLSRTERDATCNFVFQFTNHVGSTVSFKYKDIMIAPMLKEENSEIQIALHDNSGREADIRLPIVSVNHDPKIQYPLAEQATVKFTSTKEEKLKLVCDLFTSELNIKAQQIVTLADFDAAKITWGKTITVGAAEVDPRHISPAQDCRILNESNGPDSNLKFSRQFRLVQKSPDLHFSVNMNSKLFTSSKLPETSQDFMNIEVYNSSDAPASFAIGPMRVQILAWELRSPSKVGAIRDLQIQTMGGEFVVDDPEFGRILTIPSGGHIVAVYKLVFPGACFFGLGPSSSLAEAAGFDQIYTRNLSSLKLVQFANPVIPGQPFQREVYKVYEQVEKGVFPIAGSPTEIGKNIFCPGLVPQFGP